MLFENAALHAQMDMKKLLWDWILQTPFGGDNFNVDYKPNSTTKFGWQAKIKSMQGDLSPIIWLGSWISRSSPNWDVMPPILVPS